MFALLYAKVMRWSAHPQAEKYLAGLSFAESSFFPIPPDVMLAPMVLAQRHRAWFLAGLTTVASVLGGLLGYLIGYLAFASIEPWIMEAGYGHKLEIAQDWFAEWGVWVVFVAGFSPIPYKVFTITAGALHLALLPFIIASLIGRGARFFLVAGLLGIFGHKIEPFIQKYVEWLGWFVVALIVALVMYKSMS